MALFATKYKGISRRVLSRQMSAPSNAAAADLSGYGDLYVVRDMRKKSRKEPGETKSFAKSYKVVELQAKAPQNFSDDLKPDLYGKYLLDVKEFTDKEIIADLVYSNGYYQHRFRDMVLDRSQIFNYPAAKGSLYADINKRYVINKCLNYLKENKQLNEFKDLVNILKKDLAALDFIESGDLGKPTIKFEFNDNDELKKFLQENENLIESEVVDAEIVDDQPDYSRQALKGYGDTYEFTDLRKRSRKEPGDVKALSTKNINIKLKEKAPRNYIGEVFKSKTFENDDFKITYYEGPDGKFYQSGNVRYFDSYVSTDTAKDNGDSLTFLLKFNFRFSQYLKTDSDDVLYLSFEITAPFVNLRRERFGFNDYYTFYYPLDLLCFAIVKECEKILSNSKKASFRYKVADKVRFAYYRLWQSVYSTDGDINAFSLDGEALEGRDPSRYNYDLNKLECRGLKPSYKRLADYSHLITEKAINKDFYEGDGFDTTEKTLINQVKGYYKQVKPLAKHLKADSKLQSAFNIWYWLHENIKYNYDSEGREEIRTPARSWKDRFSGVDCDCLAVFTYCLLLNMDYRPQFEIVSFLGSEKWQHIYVNLDGLAIDRVLNKFGARPALITKKKMLEVPVYSLKGVPSLSGLEGLQRTCLAKIHNGTATENDCCNYRKAEALRRMGGNPVEQTCLAMFMPYIKDIDLTDGSIYFLPTYQKMAEVARWADSKLIQLAAKQQAGLYGAEYEAELNGIFKKIGNAVKNAAKAVGKAVAAPVKAVVNVTKSAVQATTNAVKATANVVKAGVQAATGNTSAARTSLARAGEQAKAAVVQPVKDAVNVTKETVKATVVDPTVTAVKVGVELVKVLLVKINPVTVLMRNAWRALIGINFLGMASRLGIGTMTEDEAKTYGYDKADWETAKKAYERSKKFFTKMGGDGAKFDKTVKNSMFKKALFKKDYKLEQVITDSDDIQGLGALGEGVTIGSCLAAVGAFFVKIWNWIKGIAPKIADWFKNNKELIQVGVEMLANRKNNDGSQMQTSPEGEGNGNGEDNGEDNGRTKKIIIGGVAVTVAAWLLTRKKGKGKGKKKRR